MRRIQYVRTHVQFRRPIQGCKSSRPFRGRARDARDQRPELRMTVIKCKVRTYVCAYVRTYVVFCQTPAIKRQQEFLSMLQRGAAKASRSIAAKAQSVNGNW